MGGVSDDSGRVVLVVGASRRIGAGTALTVAAVATDARPVERQGAPSEDAVAGG